MIHRIVAGVRISIRELGEDQADRRRDAELIFELDQGLRVGCRGFSGCRPGR